MSHDLSGKIKRGAASLGVFVFGTFLFAQVGSAILDGFNPRKIYDAQTFKIKEKYTDSNKNPLLSFDSWNAKLIKFPSGSLRISDSANLPFSFDSKEGICGQGWEGYSPKDLVSFVNNFGKRSNVPKDLVTKLANPNYFCNRFQHLSSVRKKRDSVVKEANGIYDDAFKAF